MGNSPGSLDTSYNFRRFDDLVRSERYFTATLLPLLLFHNKMEGVQHFVGLVEGKATTECDGSGKRRPKGPTQYDFKDVEVITEFHIARDLKAAHLLPDEAHVEPSEEDQRDHEDAPDVVIVAGKELLVCEGKFFSFFSKSDANDLNDQLRSQRLQVKRLFQKNGQIRPIRAYRHVAIVPFDPTTVGISIDADVVLTWDDIRHSAETLMGPDHYVTVRLRYAVARHIRERGDPTIPYFDEKNVSFDDMRKMCRDLY
jgi:hypothetical protein